MIHRICVFCGSASGARPEYVQAAEELGRELVRQGIELVYGGGRIGLMGTIADTVLAAGGTAIGIIPEQLFAREVGHTGLTHLHIVGSMHARKALMVELSDAFIAMPGGFGTLEEFSEVLTWAQLGIHSNPCGLLDVDGYFDHLISFFDLQVTEGFLTPLNRSLVVMEREPKRLLELLEGYSPPVVRRWVSRDEI